MRGVIFNHENKAIPFAHIKHIETNTVGISNLNGEFELIINSNNKSFEISNVGFKSIVIDLNFKYLNKIYLQEDEIVLNEIKVSAEAIKNLKTTQIIKKAMSLVKKNYVSIAYGHKEHCRFDYYTDNILDKSLYLSADFFHPNYRELNAENISINLYNTVYYSKFKSTESRIVNQIWLLKNVIAFHTAVDYEIDITFPFLVRRKLFSYRNLGLLKINSELVYKISFNSIRDKLFYGLLYINAENFAIVKIENQFASSNDNIHRSIVQYTLYEDKYYPTLGL